MNLHHRDMTAPLIVGIGGTPKVNSSSEIAVRQALEMAEASGARTRLFNGPALMMPLYDPSLAERDDKARELVSALRQATGVIIASPAYHGSISGLLKNALDYTEDMRDDDAPYLDGRAVGCIACAAGWQAASTTLVTLRSIVHALRGWNVPLGVAINTTTGATHDGAVASADVERALATMVEQIMRFCMSGFAPSEAGRAGA
ncbi:MAG TPA: NAD(P)H-dependent oxidoreductase [Pseudolabrys sp.]|nr:NAD(P)H-dependent oxidoreductase [Pseudolabrys sp.]